MGFKKKLKERAKDKLVEAIFKAVHDNRGEVQAALRDGGAEESFRKTLLALAPAFRDKILTKYADSDQKESIDAAIDIAGGVAELMSKSGHPIAGLIDELFDGLEEALEEAAGGDSDAPADPAPAPAAPAAPPADPAPPAPSGDDAP